MPETPEDDARQRLFVALQKGDDSSRASRIERIIQASAHEVSFGIISGRAESLALLEDARTCYVNGQNIAALIIAVSYIEHELADALNPNGDPSKLPFEAAIKAARRECLFDVELLEQADHLRRLRNPYVHRRPADDADTLGARIATRKEHPTTIQEGDAIEALKVMYGFLRHKLYGQSPVALDSTLKGDER